MKARCNAPHRIPPRNAMQSFRSVGPAPVITKFIEQPRAEHDFAILSAFTLPNMNQHAGAIDVADLQMNQFLAPHSGRIQREKPDPMQGTCSAFDKPLRLFPRQDLG